MYFWIINNWTQNNIAEPYNDYWVTLFNLDISKPAHLDFQIIFVLFGLGFGFNFSRHLWRK